MVMVYQNLIFPFRPLLALHALLALLALLVLLALLSLKSIALAESHSDSFLALLTLTDMTSKDEQGRARTSKDEQGRAMTSKALTES